MSNLSPQRLQELAAGYVLGDLSSDEAELFQAQLQQHPYLQEEVARLREVLGAMPYGLPEVEPPPGLRGNILAMAEAEKQPQRGAVVDLDARRRVRRGRWQPVAGGIAAVAAIALVADNLRLRQNLQYVRAQLDWQTSEFATMVVPSETVLANQWDGLDRLAEDHLSAMARDRGPMDYNASDIRAIIDRFDRQFTFPETNPVIASRGVKLMGGSLCAFGKIYGLRYTYTTDDGRTLSFYQIDTRNEQLSIPKTGSGKLYIHQPGKPPMVLWSDDVYVYAMVAELAPARLKSLSADVVMH